MDLAARSNLRLLPRPPPGSRSRLFVSIHHSYAASWPAHQSLPPLRLLGKRAPLSSTPLLPSPTPSPSVFSLARRNSSFSVVAGRKEGSFSRIMCFLLHHVASKLGITETEESISCNILSANNDVRISDVLSTRICRAGLRPSGS